MNFWQEFQGGGSLDHGSSSLYVEGPTVPSVLENVDMSGASVSFQGGSWAGNKATPWPCGSWGDGEHGRRSQTTLPASTVLISSSCLLCSLELCLLSPHSENSVFWFPQNACAVRLGDF